MDCDSLVGAGRHGSSAARRGAVASWGSTRCAAVLVRLCSGCGPAGRLASARWPNGAPRASARRLRCRRVTPAPAACALCSRGRDCHWWLRALPARRAGGPATLVCTPPRAPNRPMLACLGCAASAPTRRRRLLPTHGPPFHACVCLRRILCSLRRDFVHGVQRCTDGAALCSLGWSDPPTSARVVRASLTPGLRRNGSTWRGRRACWAAAVVWGAEVRRLRPTSRSRLLSVCSCPRCYARCEACAGWRWIERTCRGRLRAAAHAHVVVVEPAWPRLA